MAKAKKRGKRRRRAPRARRPTTPAASADAERHLLVLAARVSAIAAEHDAPETSLRAAIDELLAAYAADGPLAATLTDAWRGARADKRAALALAWAREQLRLAIEDVLAREAKADRIRPGLGLDALAWLVLVAAESIVYEPAGVAIDRAETLLAIVGRFP
jgi:hypothetical protein